MVKALKLIMYKERLGQSALFNQERRKLRNRAALFYCPMERNKGKQT